ncbi:DUF5926 family protein [Actinomycetaceae bacterium MB13-C1-2]|nr:DUF5926 family protein [Actinomycetaceae bacterium MB13-C1-2]
MGKASRRKKITPAKAAAYRPPIAFVERPFEGIAVERELVAMRELIPCAILAAKTNKDLGGTEFDFVTLLPDGAPAMVRSDGRILVGLQTRFNTGDLSHDLGGALQAAIELKQAGEDGVVAIDVRDPAPRLQELLDESFLRTVASDDESPMQITEDFSYWFDPDEEHDADTLAALEQNREDMVPTEEVPGVPGMYWCQMNNNFIRYVTNVPEDKLFTALARVQSDGGASVGEGSRFVGAFRACGIAIPVFQVAPDVTAAQLAEPAAKLQKALEVALASKEPLNDDQKRVRAGLISRQVTIR